MRTAKGSTKQYLKRIGNTWYVNVRVPRTLEKALGTTHIRLAGAVGEGLGLLLGIDHRLAGQVGD